VGQKEIIRKHQGLLIAPVTKHSIENETTESLEFLAISQPTTNDDRILIEE
jgi:mannose-6-phosphate isomerase-like protein (cupin superfamily)